jgi:hypothetical protein
MERFMMATRVAAISLALLVFQAVAARADAIDGDWCAADGQRMSIKGASITTPGGKTIEGNYTRHAFDYVIPSGEQGSGEAVNILLRGEYLAVSRQGSSSAPLKEWRRCKETISQLEHDPESGYWFSEKIMLNQS